MMPTAHRSRPAGELPLWEATLPVLTAAEAYAPASARFETPGDDEPRDEAPPAAREAEPQELLDEARRKAEHIVQRAREQAASAVREATRKARGEVAARQTEAFGQVVELIRADLTAQLQEALRDLELDAARLCTALAETVVRRKIAQDDEMVIEVVREGLGRMVGAREITLRVSPAAQEALEAARETLAGDLPGAVAITIVPDETISTGGAVLQSANGELDLRIETQMARVREAAEAALGRESAEEEQT